MQRGDRVINLKLKILLLLPAAFMLLLVACGEGSQPPPNIGATVEAKLSALNIEASIDARVEDKLLLSKHHKLCKQEVSGWNPFNSTTKFRYGCT